MRRSVLTAIALMLAMPACGTDRDRPAPPACMDSAPGQARLAAAADPDGQFEFDDNESDIYLVNLDGSKRQRLTTAPGNDFSPTWSPDATQIAFRSNRDRTGDADDNDEIYVMCADGSQQQRLTHTPDVQERSPAFSPDGRWLAFAGQDRDTVLDLYVMRPDGSGRRKLTGRLNCGAEYPSWSPDGEQIAFHCFHQLDNLEIYVINVDGSHPRRVTHDAREDSFPAWAPSGREILFTGGAADLYLIRPDGSHRRRLTRDPSVESFAQWSPDGTHIVFGSDRGRDALSYQIYVMAADGTGIRQVTHGRASHFTPAWVPR